MGNVVLPVDRLADVWPTSLRSPELKLGAVLHPASVDSRLEHTLTALLAKNRALFRLGALFGPQHGFDGTTQDNMIEWEGGMHPQLGVALHSLYGEHREPTEEMLAPIDAVFVDLMDVGARYYTFIWTLFLCMKACQAHGKPILVADRPNPINGIDTEGGPQESDHLSFVGLHPIPIRHAKTIGELAIQFQQEAFPDVELHVLPMEGWERTMWWDETGLPWVLPSPNMPTLDTAVVYPGMCLFEGCNVSEGRGTTRPFEIFGAPWINAPALVDSLDALQLPGVHFRSLSFEPTFQKHAHQICQGAQIHVSDRQAYRPVHSGIRILQTIQDLYLEHFAWNPPPYEYEEEKLPIEILIGRPLAEENRL